MCKSKAEGGARCFSHTNKAYQKTLGLISQTTQAIEEGYARYNDMTQSLVGLDQRGAQMNKTSAEIDHERNRIQSELDHGDIYLAKLDHSMVELQAKAKSQLAEVRTTHTGLKMLKEQIDASTNPDEKRTLQVTYNASKRLGAQRKRLWERHKKNAELAEKYEAIAGDKRAEYDLITGDDQASNELRESLLVEYQENTAKAHLARHDGRMEVQALYDAQTGKIVPAKVIQGKFGPSWKILESADPNSHGKDLFNLARGKTAASKHEYYAKKGYILGTVWVPGQVNIHTGEDGSRKVQLARTDGGFSERAVLGNLDFYKDKMQEETKTSAASKPTNSAPAQSRNRTPQNSVTQNRSRSNTARSPSNGYARQR